jgi:hypothetical protein
MEFSNRLFKSPLHVNSLIHLALRTPAIRTVDLRWIACDLVLSANMLIVFLFVFGCI